MNHFEFFDIPIQFYPDLKHIAKQFKLNTLANHPDLNKGDEPSELLTAQNNQAYAILRNERKRIFYILNLHIKGQDKVTLPPDFLMEMMEMNEDLMETKMEGKGVSEKLALIENKDKSIWERIEALGKQCDKGSIAINEACQKVNNLYLQSNYMLRIIDNHGS